MSNDLATLALSVAGGAISVALASIAFAHSALRRVRRVEDSIHPERVKESGPGWFARVASSLRPRRAPEDDTPPDRMVIRRRCTFHIRGERCALPFGHPGGHVTSRREDD